MVEYADGSKETIGAATGTDNPVSAAPNAGLNVHPTEYPAVSTVKPMDKLVPDSKGLTGYNVYYQLDNGGFALLENTMETTYVHEGMALYPGLHQYYVTAVYDEGESDPSNTVEILIDALGENRKDDLRVYPNPAADRVMVEADEEILSVEVYDFTGRRVIREIVRNTICGMDVRTLNPGPYILQVETVSGRTAIRVVKK